MHDILRQGQQILKGLPQRPGLTWALEVDYTTSGSCYRQCFAYTDQGDCHDEQKIEDSSFKALTNDHFQQHGAFFLRTNTRSGYLWKDPHDIVFEKDPNVAFSPHRHDWKKDRLRHIATIAQCLRPWPENLALFPLQTPASLHEKLALERLHPALLTALETLDHSKIRMGLCPSLYGIFLVLITKAGLLEPLHFYPHP